MSPEIQTLVDEMNKNIEKVSQTPESQDVFLGFLMEITPVEPLPKKSPKPELASLTEAMRVAEEGLKNLADSINKAARSTEEFNIIIDNSKLASSGLSLDSCVSGECADFGVYRDMADYIGKNRTPLG